MVVACLALIVALSGTGYAAVVLGPNTVGTVQLKANAVTTQKVKNGTLMKADFKAGQVPVGPVGPAGPAGPAGAAGPAGPAGPGVKWALVKADGSIQSQSGGISLTSHPSAGAYILDFGSAVAGHAVLVTPGVINANYRGGWLAGPCGGAPEGYACPAGNDTNHAIVFMENPGDTPLGDFAFYVVVFQ
jgi:hypothetical protein